MRRLDRPVGYILLVLSLLLIAGNSHAFDLAQLSRQLNEPAVVRGNFIQEKYLRALPLPLTSRGTFVLARNRGLLWFLQEPLQQDYRISDSGITRRGPSGWQKADQQGPAGRQNDMFLAVLHGDIESLQRDFELELSGTVEAWQLMLTPRSLLLGQIFTAILIRGGATVERIELLETQGDSTALLLNDSQIDDQLSATELHDFAN
jgi:hypothetical protein